MHAGETTVAVDGGAIVGVVTFKPPPATRGSPFYDRDDVASFVQFAVRAVAPGLGGSGVATNYRSVICEEHPRDG